MQGEAQSDRMDRGGVVALADDDVFDGVEGHLVVPQDIMGCRFDVLAVVATRSDVLHERVQFVGYPFQDWIPRRMNFGPSGKGHAVSLTNCAPCGSLDWWR